MRHLLTLIGGFLLLAAGIVMLVTPGPGWAAIALGLGLLARHFHWARRLLDRLKKTGRAVLDKTRRT